jgi:hypothetical protein
MRAGCQVRVGLGWLDCFCFRAAGCHKGVLYVSVAAADNMFRSTCCGWLSDLPPNCNNSCSTAKQSRMCQRLPSAGLATRCREGAVADEEGA